MVVKTAMFFRNCFPYTSKTGDKKLALRFLDDKDKSFSFIIDDNERTQKFKTLKKDSLIDLELTLYPIKSTTGHYGLFLKV